MSKHQTANLIIYQSNSYLFLYLGSYNGVVNLLIGRKPIVQCVSAYAYFCSCCLVLSQLLTTILISPYLWSCFLHNALTLVICHRMQNLSLQENKCFFFVLWKHMKFTISDKNLNIGTRCALIAAGM